MHKGCISMSISMATHLHRAQIEQTTILKLSTLKLIIYLGNKINQNCQEGLC